jgi:hypothetical protein
MADPLNCLALFWVRKEGAGTTGWLEMMVFFIDNRLERRLYSGA